MTTKAVEELRAALRLYAPYPPEDIIRKCAAVCEEWERLAAEKNDYLSEQVLRDCRNDILSALDPPKERGDDD